ncbi:MAG TPA: hypothetical protein VJO33_02550 [Gemmatimonadaceae bacterium]|nr:hypothetical protein [Gemmatimonadaceae bacterium]
MWLRNSTVFRAALGIVLIATASLGAEAQGRGGGVGRRSRGGEGDHAARHEDDAAKPWTERFEDMASTKEVLKDVKVDKAANDSISRIEKTYKDHFHSYANAAKRVFDDAQAQSQPPKYAQLDTLVQYGHDLQDREYAEIRQLLAPDQRATFDANITRRRTEEEQAAAKHRHPSD